MNYIVWPYQLLKPAECRAYINPFTRSGGRTLGGIKPSTRTDLGPWSIDLVDVAIRSIHQRRAWDAVATEAGGSSGRIVVPAWAIDSAPYASGQTEPLIDVPHDDGATFSDGTRYRQGAISVASHGVTAIGATVMSMRLINGDEDLTGVRFSYRHALYQTGRALSVDGDVWTVRISPSIRELIPDGSDLEFDRPTCICNLVDDTGMKRSINADRFEQLSVSFIEDTDYWYKVAKGLI